MRLLEQDMDAALKELKEEERGNTAMVSTLQMEVPLSVSAEEKNGPVSADDEPDHRTRP